MAKRKLKKNYGALIGHLSKVWKISEISDQESLWHLGRAEREALDPNQIRVAIWNVCKGAGGIHFEQDYRHLYQSSDIILIQEALLSVRGMMTYIQPGIQGTHAASYSRSDGLRDGVLTLSRSRLVGAERILSQKGEPLFNTTKAALFSKVSLGADAGELQIVNVHSPLIRGRVGVEKEVNHLISQAPLGEGPCIIGGDFNTFSAAYLEVYERVFASHGFLHAKVNHDPRTRLQSLDHLFMRGLEVVDLRVETKIRNSDHFPIVATLRLEV